VNVGEPVIFCVCLLWNEFHTLRFWTRVARWFVFKPKIPLWVNVVGSCYGKSWYILWSFDLFYSHWKYFMAILYIFGNLVNFPRFGILDQEKSGNPVLDHK
jgi:hypothetical protein